MQDKYARHFWRLNDKTKVKENSLYYDRVYNSLLPTDKTIKILDIGCGSGHFLHYLQRHGYNNILGIDQSPELVKFIKEEISPQVVCGDALDYLQQHPNEFDVLVANDFIEHLPKHKIDKFLELCYLTLNTNGKLLIKTPNMENLFASHHRYVDFTHEVGFTETSLYQVCTDAGFTSVIIHPEFSTPKNPFSYYLIRWLYRQLNELPPRIFSINLIAECNK